jgi:hypothetical protein
MPYRQQEEDGEFIRVKYLSGILGAHHQSPGTINAVGKMGDDIEIVTEQMDATRIDSSATESETTIEKKGSDDSSNQTCESNSRFGALRGGFKSKPASELDDETKEELESLNEETTASSSPSASPKHTKSMVGALRGGFKSKHNLIAAEISNGEHQGSPKSEEKGRSRVKIKKQKQNKSPGRCGSPAPGSPAERREKSPTRNHPTGNKGRKQIMMLGS